MKYLDDFRYREIPTDENSSQYSTILDILEDIAEEEKIGCVTIDPILRNVITGMIRR